METTAQASPPRAFPSWAPAACIAAATILAYLPVFACGWIWDDPEYVTRNPVLRTWGGLADIWLHPLSIPQWYPVVHTTFWLEVRLWGLHPPGFHAVNVLLHAANAILLWRVLRSLGVPGAWLAGMLFALHPVEVESVAWVTERKNVLSGLFYLLALRAWIRFDGDPGPARRRAWLAAAGLFVLALLSKTVTATLPALALVLVWWKRGRIGRRDVVPLLPLLALGMGFGLMTAWLEKSHVGAEGADWALSAADRVVLAGRALWFYAWKILLPVNLTFIYPRWTIDAGVPWQWIFPLGALGILVALLLLRGRIGRGPFAAAACFAGTLFPALGFVDVYPFRYSFVADHFQYLASAALLALLGAGLARAAERAEALRRGAGTAGLVAVLAALSLLTSFQCPMYRDEEALWRETVRRNPQAWIGWNNLGVIAVRRDATAEAEALFRRAVEGNPRNYEALSNIGNCRLAAGDVEGAIGWYRKSLLVQPVFVQARMNMADASLRKWERDRDAAAWEEALACYREVTRIQANLADARWNLVRMLEDAKRFDEALEACRAAVDALNEDSRFRVKEGSLLLGRGDLPGAVATLRKAAAEFPRLVDSRLALGEALYRAGDHDGSLLELRAAMALEPEAPKVRANFVVALLGAAGSRGMAGRYVEAVPLYREALAVDAGSVTAGNSLAWILATAKDEALRRPDEALALATRVVARKGRGDPWILDTLAAAQAAAGRFEDAARTVEEAVALPAARENQPFLEDLRRRLAAYREGRAWRE